MKDMSIKDKLIRLVKIIQTINDRMPHKFIGSKGLRQNNSRPTTLFNIVLEAAIRRSGIQI